MQVLLFIEALATHKANIVIKFILHTLGLQIHKQALYNQDYDLKFKIMFSNFMGKLPKFYLPITLLALISKFSTDGNI